MRRTTIPAGLIAVSLASLLLWSCGGSGGYGSSGGGGSTGIATNISISPDAASITMGTTEQYKAVAKDMNGNTLSGVTLTWRSSNTAVATVDSSGLATAVTSGTAGITASVTYNSGGSYTSGPGTTYTSNTAILTVTTRDMVMGMVATGRALPGALVTLKDSSGKTAAALSGNDGRFQVSTAGMRPPFLLKADDGRGHVLFGAAAADGSVANLNPVTDLMVRAWYGAHGTSPEAAFAAGRQLLPDAKSQQALDRAFGAALADSLDSAGVDSAHFSLFSSPFNADHTGFDAVLDTTRVSGGAHPLLQDVRSGRTTEVSVGNGRVTLSSRGPGMMATEMRNIDLH